MYVTGPGNVDTKYTLVLNESYLNNEIEYVFPPCNLYCKAYKM